MPANFLSRSTPELDFCNTRVAPFLQIATEEVALAVGKPPSINIVCGGSYDDMPQPLPELVTVTCTVADAGASNARDPNCIDLGDAGVPFDAGDGGGGESCESIPCIVSGPGTNCPIQGPSIALDSCKCTDPFASGCTTSQPQPVCRPPNGEADPLPLMTSPMTAIVARAKTVTIDPTRSHVNVNVDVPVCINLLVTQICDDATGSATTGVSGRLNLYGGPCPGQSCNVQLDGIALVDDVSISVSDQLGLFGETDSITATQIRLGVPNALIAVDPTGAATLAPGQLTFDAVGNRNGQLVEQQGANDQPVPIQIDWGARTLRISNFSEPIARSKATLNLTGTFGPSLVDQIEQFIPAYDSDHDGVPDRIDNCPFVANANQVPVPPVFGAAPNLTLTACDSNAPVTLSSPSVTDSCDKTANVTGEIVAVDGKSVSLSVTPNGAIVFPSRLEATLVPIEPPPAPPGPISAVLPPGTVTIVWTATDTNGATSTVTQTIASSSLPVLYASGTLNVDDGTIIRAGDGSPGVVMSKGTGTTNIGSTTQVGDVLSQGPVFLRSNGQVRGLLETGGLLTTQSGATISGTVAQNDAVIVFPSFPNQSFTLPSPRPAPVDLEPNQTSTIVPGSYGSVAIKQGAVLTLNGTGTYTFGALDLEPQSTVRINSAAGPIVIDVTDSILFNGGAFVDSGHPSAPDLLLAYSGTQAVNVAVPFNGAIFAPSASLTLDTVSAGFIGQFAANILEVAPHTSVTHRPYHCSL